MLDVLDNRGAVRAFLTARGGGGAGSGGGMQYTTVGPHVLFVRTAPAHCRRRPALVSHCLPQCTSIPLPAPPSPCELSVTLHRCSNSGDSCKALRHGARDEVQEAQGDRRPVREG